MALVALNALRELNKLVSPVHVRNSFCRLPKRGCSLNCPLAHNKTRRIKKNVDQLIKTNREGIKENLMNVRRKKNNALRI